MTAPTPVPASDPTPAPGSSTPPSGGTPNPATPPAGPWRVPETDPRPWARGKTTEEVLGITEALYDVAQKFNQQQAVPPAPPAQPQWGINDEDYLTGKQAKELADRMMAQMNQHYAQAPNPALEIAASNCLAIVQGRHAADFGRYGPEIQTYLARVPKNAWTVDNLEEVVNLVRSKHLDDLAAERAQQLVANMAPTIRPNGGVGSPAASNATPQSVYDREDIPAAWKERARKANLTDRQINDYCTANDITVEQFVAQFKAPLSDAVGSHV